MGAPRLLIATELGAPGDGIAVAAAIAVAVAAREGGEARGAMLVEVGARARRRPTLLSSASARALEEKLRGAGFGAAARGRICWAGVALEGAWPERLRALVEAASPQLMVVHLPPVAWRRLLDGEELMPDGALVRADVRPHRPLLALAVAELRARGLAVRVATRPLGLVGARRALAGLDPGGPAAARTGRMARVLVPPRPHYSGKGPTVRPAPGESGQALPLVAGIALLVVALALALTALGGAVTAAARTQRAADLAALSAARSMRDDLPRLLAPARLPDGSENPAHLDRSEYLARAEATAHDAARRNGEAAADVEFPDAASSVPVRARVELDGQPSRWAEAEAAPPAGVSAAPATASGGGYDGPLAYRQGKPMRPDVAAAFDEMAAAASRAGISLLVNSAYRSDAEQASLFAQHPDPRWVAPPGTSLHRCATELDLGPPGAYGWLAANAGRYGFTRRYEWEPWHFGFTRGPAPCSPAAPGPRGADPVGGSSALPDYVPERFREPLARAAADRNVSARLLAAQLMAESGFDPTAVSPAGAQGIAQFMPATAAAYGLRDPFDPEASIDAQARLMADLLRQFGSTALALAAYNAGPGAVAACNCVPPYPETQAYVARILALAGAAGDPITALEVRLVE